MSIDTSARINFSINKTKRPKTFEAIHKWKEQRRNISDKICQSIEELFAREEREARQPIRVSPLLAACPIGNGNGKAVTEEEVEAKPLMAPVIAKHNKTHRNIIADVDALRGKDSNWLQHKIDYLRTTSSGDEGCILCAELLEKTEALIEREKERAEWQKHSDELRKYQEERERELSELNNAKVRLDKERKQLEELEQQMERDEEVEHNMAFGRKMSMIAQGKQAPDFEEEHKRTWDQKWDDYAKERVEPYKIRLEEYKRKRAEFEEKYEMTMMDEEAAAEEVEEYLQEKVQQPSKLNNELLE
jgi:hypothetical protein